MRTNTKPGLRRLTLLALLGLSGALSSCVTTQPYIHHNVENSVRLLGTAAHAFRYVNVTEDDGELVVYGKIEHNHLACKSEGHVDVAVLNGNASPAFSTSIPVVRRNSRPHGWYGAAFRARLPVRLTEGQTVRLAFHDDGCVTTQAYNCRDNQALSSATGEGPSVRDGEK